MTARTSLPPAPVGQQAPPIDHGHGLASYLKPEGNTEIRKCIQRSPLAPRATLIGIDRNG